MINLMKKLYYKDLLKNSLNKREQCVKAIQSIDSEFYLGKRYFDQQKADDVKRQYSHKINNHNE